MTSPQDAPWRVQETQPEGQGASLSPDSANEADADRDPVDPDLTRADAENSHDEAVGGLAVESERNLGTGPGAWSGEPKSEAQEMDASSAETVASDGASPLVAADLDGQIGVDQAAGPMQAPVLKLPAILALANQKGGVGKTTTAVNLGAGLADLGLRVMLVDLDPQGNATTGLGLNARSVSGSTYHVIMQEAEVDDCIEPTSVRNLFVMPATIDLAGAEIELVSAMSRELRLRRALEEVRDRFDVILIDCPPSLGLLTVNGLAAADGVVVPIQCEYYALEGLGQLLRNVSLVRRNLNPGLDVHGIVLTMFDARTKLAEQVEREVREHFESRVYRTVIPRTVRISEAPSFGQPITVFDASSRGAIAYRSLAEEVSRGATRRTG